MNPRLALVIVRKDVTDAIKNMYLLFAIVLPIAMSLLFSVLFPSDSGTGGMSIEMAVYDPGQSQFVQQLIATQQFSTYIVGSADEVRAQVAKGRTGGLVVPMNFDADLVAGRSPELQVYYNGTRSSLQRATFQQIVSSVLRDMAGQKLPATIIATDVSGTSGAGTASFSLSNYYLLLFLVMSLTMVGVFVVPYILVEEKEKGTLSAVLVTPASYADVVAGKALVGLFYALLVALTLMIMNKGFVGNVPLTVLALVLGSLFVVMVGLLMGAVFKTTTQVNTWSSIVMLALLLPGMLGDFLSVPEPITIVMRLIPTSYMARLVTHGMADMATLPSAAVDIAVLAGATVAAFAAVIWFLRRERQ